jgi:hypothetical protein
VFGSAPLDPLHWGIVLAGGAVLFVLVEAEKLMLRRLPSDVPARAPAR